MKSLANAMAAVTHPLLILTYGLLILLSVDAYSFGSKDLVGQVPLIIITALYTFILPLLSILVLRFIGFIDSMQMHKREERIGPLMITLVFYTWMFVNFRNNPDLPASLTLLTLGAVISIGLSFLVTVFDKISLHCVGLAGLATFVLILILQFEYQYTEWWTISLQLILLFVILVIVAGVVGSTRLFLKAHRAGQIYAGYFVGIVGQLAAWRILLSLQSLS